MATTTAVTSLAVAMESSGTSGGSASATEERQEM